MNNPNLPTVGAEFEYTPEMVKDLKKCQKNILHFAEKFFYIISLDEGKQPINLHYCQKRALRKMRDHRFFILLASRQIGKTTMMTIYALWIACFNNDQRILIVANKEGTALEIMSRIRMAYEELPNWLKPGVKEYGKTSIVLANGTKIGISTTTGTAGEAGTIQITGRGYNVQNDTQDAGNQKAHDENSEFKLALNHIIINDKADKSSDNIFTADIQFT